MTCAWRFFLLSNCRQALRRVPRRGLPLRLGLGLLVSMSMAVVAQAQTGNQAATQPSAKTAKPKLGFLEEAADRAIFSVGWQVGQYTQHGMGNMYYHALRLNRNADAASVEKPMEWTETYGGPTFCLTYTQPGLTADLRWTNRHTRRSAQWTDLDGTTWNTDYRTRLNEVSIGLGHALWGGKIRPGISADIGLFRVSRRDSEGRVKSKWTSMHFDNPSDAFFVAPGRMSPTAGLTLYCDVAPLGRLGGGPTVRVFHQWHIMEPDLFGLAGTRDTRSFQYGIHNYGLALSWGLAL